MQTNKIISLNTLKILLTSLHLEDNRSDGNNSLFYKYPRELLRGTVMDHRIH